MSQLKVNRKGLKRRRLPIKRRGVVGILAMMFLVMFGSLAVAMAVVTQGNLRTASSHLHVTRTLGSVDTGMGIAAARLNEAASRFMVSKGRITPAYASELWYGTYSGDPAVSVIDPVDGRDEDSPPTSIMAALANHHAADSAENVVAADGSNAAAPIVLPTAPDGWVVTDPIGVQKDAEGVITTAVQISYVPPDNLGRVLAVVTGYDWDYSRRRWVTRTAQQYFNITKTVKHAILGPTRMMIGRDVQVNGPLGVLYNSSALDSLDGPPLVIRSDFYGLDNVLDEKLDDFYAQVLAHDVNGDNRLRVSHAVESQGLSAINGTDYDNDGQADNAFNDSTRDNTVDDFDIFLNHYDTNNDGKVALSTALTDGTPNEGINAEFTADNALSLLIDSGKPDRNRNGRYNGEFEGGVWDFTTFRDNNLDGLYDEQDVDNDDVTLGYRDGVLDYKDQYAKVRGSVFFRASRSDWESSHDDFNVAVGDYQQFVRGAIRTGTGEVPVTFDASNAEAPLITPSSFEAATEALIDIAEDPGSFAEQVAEAKGDNWTPPRRVESTPYGSPTPADWYSRPVYEGITFKNVTIPMGTNGLFIDCTFAGVTRVECYQDNDHPSWTFYGEEERNPTTGQLTLKYPPPPAVSNSALDTSYSTPGAPGYDALPDPLTVPVDLNDDGTANDQCTNTKLISNNIRFHNCIFVGSIVADQPQIFTQVRNKLQFTGATRFTDEHPEYPDDPRYNPDSDDLDVIATSSMMLPNYSVDIGTNNSPQEQDVHLRGAIIAGVLDIRGNTRIDGVIMLTFEPVYGEAPMELYGNAAGDPADFNITLGYFGPEDGDLEGVDIADMTDLDGNGTPDAGWDSARDESGNLIPLAGWNGTHNEAWYDGITDDDANIAPNTYVRRAVPFNGFGKVQLNWDPDITLPDGLASPLSINPIASTYEEGRFVIED